MSEELMPCFFCECDEVLVIVVDEVTDAGAEEATVPLYAASCPYCGARGPMALSEEEAVEAWNRRAERESRRWSKMPNDNERREVTADLSRAVEARLKGKSGIYAPEVEVPGGRVDYMAFHPYNPITMGGVCAATVERGTFACYEVKSCWDDYTSGHGLNFVGDENWLVCPRDLAERLRGKSIGCGILVPDKAGRLRTFVEQPFGGYRKLSASELIWRMLRTSYGIEGGAQNAD